MIIQINPPGFLKFIRLFGLLMAAVSLCLCSINPLCLFVLLVILLYSYPRSKQANKEIVELHFDAVTKVWWHHEYGDFELLKDSFVSSVITVLRFKSQCNHRSFSVISSGTPTNKRLYQAIRQSI